MKGYHAARNVLNLEQVDVHQIHFHQDRIWSELLPLLDTLLESTSDPAMRSWCYIATATIADLFSRIRKVLGNCFCTFY